MAEKKKQARKAASTNEVEPLKLGGASGYVPPEKGVGGRIKEKREELGMNFEELARLTSEYDYTPVGRGITASTLRRYESGGFNPGAREICLLCDALDVSADFLVRGIEAVATQDTPVSKASNAFINAVLAIIEEHENPVGDMAEAKNRVEWKQIERMEKLRRARLPSK